MQLIPLKSNYLFKSKRLILLIAITCTAISIISPAVEAKRLGGGSGNKVGRPVNNSVFQGNYSSNPYNRPAPMNAPMNAPINSPMNAPMNAKPANKWIGPLAGLAAGAGLMALMSNMGIGAGMGEFLSNIFTYGALILLGLFIYRRFIAKKNTPAFNNQSTYSNSFSNNTPTNNPLESSVFNKNTYNIPDSNASYPPIVHPNNQSSNAHSSIPDNVAFVNNAKSQYLALQTAWDAGDLSKLRTMTTDHLFMELAQQIANRKGAPNHTEIMNLHCELLDVRDEHTDTVATLRFTGTAREDHQPTTGIEDIWILTKPAQSNQGWLLAGVENK